MEKNELFEIANEIKTVEKLKQNEKRLVDSVTNFVIKELAHVDDHEKVQHLVNKCVNSFAATLRDEIGLMDKEGAKVLERVRIVSASTVARDKKKNAPAVSGK
ncbi:MAG: hypothetical protein GY822_13665 [Deltaproteobacteria bacterium]|nr:hypothetical protein [Deltaproteobacteria bacterium]